MKDLVGTWLSGLCVLHCLLAPTLLLLGASGFVANAAHSLEVHLFFYLAVLIVAAISFPSAYQQHKQRQPLIIGGLGVVCLSFAFFAEILFHWHTAEVIMTIIGGIFMIAAHLLNKRSLAFLAATVPLQR